MYHSAKVLKYVPYSPRVLMYVPYSAKVLMCMLYSVLQCKCSKVRALQHLHCKVSNVRALQCLKNKGSKWYKQMSVMNSRKMLYHVDTVTEENKHTRVIESWDNSFVILILEEVNGTNEFKKE